MIELPGKYTTARVMIDDVEAETQHQIHNFINNETFTNPVAIMPDCHAGKGAVIGFTMELTDRVIPNVVGVDIACGMHTMRLAPGSLNGINLTVLDDRIREIIPMGKEVRSREAISMMDGFDWQTLQRLAVKFADKFNNRYGTNFRPPEFGWAWFLELCRKVNISSDYAAKSIGSLGGGNHFIEIGIDEKEYIWVTVHSGSRNLGLKIANYWQKVAVERRHERLGLRVNKEAEIKRIKETYPKYEWNQHIKKINQRNKQALASDGLEYLEGEDMFGYLIDSVFAYQYAQTSRTVMSRLIYLLLSEPNVIETVNTVHNYIDPHDFIVRKGAIASYKNHRMIVPFNMEDGILICEGRSNPEWNFSAPHGAGRVYSRAEAKRKLNLNAARASMKSKGIFTSNIPLDEVKDAYKPAKVIEDAIEPTAEIIHRIRPIMNLKAGDEDNAADTSKRG